MIVERVENRRFYIYRMAPKSKPLPNDQKIVLRRACQWD